MDRQYKIVNDIANKAKSIESNCNAIIFTNRGTTAAFINGERIEQNQFVSNSGQANEMDTTKYDVTFEDTTDRRVYIRKKIYV